MGVKLTIPVEIDLEELAKEVKVSIKNDLNLDMNTRLQLSMLLDDIIRKRDKCLPAPEKMVDEDGELCKDCIFSQVSKDTPPCVTCMGGENYVSKDNPDHKTTCNYCVHECECVSSVCGEPYEFEFSYFVKSLKPGYRKSKPEPLCYSCVNHGPVSFEKCLNCKSNGYHDYERRKSEQQTDGKVLPEE